MHNKPELQVEKVTLKFKPKETVECIAVLAIISEIYKKYTILNIKFERYVTINLYDHVFISFTYPLEIIIEYIPCKHMIKVVKDVKEIIEKIVGKLRLKEVKVTILKKIE